MKPIFNVLLGLLLSFSTFTLGAQVLNLSFSPAQPGGSVGSVITVDVIANKFEGIAGAQFPILYNASKLQFKTIKNLTPDLPNFNYQQATGTPPLCPGGTPPPCNTNIDNPVPGKISLVWFDPSGAGAYLNDNTVLFSIEFTVLATGNTPIYIGAAAPPSINVFGEGNVPATFTYPVGPPVINGFALIVPNDSVRVGETVCFPVQVNDFNNIITMQFMVNWNSNVYSFSHVQNYGLAGMSCGSFNSNTAGRLSVQWEDQSAAGVTLPNFTSIFEVCLIANGPGATNNSSSTIACNGVGMPASSPIEIGNTSNQNVWSNSTSSIPGTFVVSNTAQIEDEIVRFIADTLTVASVGTPAVVNIKATKFKNLNQFQFVLSYDTDVLGTALPTWVPSPSLPNGTASPVCGGGTQFQVELIPGQAGKLKVSWRQCSASSGVTLPDGSNVVTLTFPTSTAAPGAFTALTIGSLESVTPPALLQAQERPNTFVANSRTPNCAYRPKTKEGFVKISNATTVPTVTLVSKTDVNCFGVNTGSIDINVSGGTTTQYTYNWSGPGITPSNQTVQDPTNLSPGTYQVTVTAGTATSSLAVPVVIAGPSAAIAATSAITGVKCFGGQDGIINLTVTGGTAPYTYLWTGGATTEDRNGLAGGSYSVTITDSKGCTHVPSSFSVSTPSAAMAITASNIKNVRCFGESNGGCNTSTANATGALTYVWKNSSGVQVSVAQNPNNLPAGTYTVTVTDANGCTDLLPQPVTISNPSSPLVVESPIITQPACAGQASGEIIIIASGGWNGYSIEWSMAPGTGGFNPMNVLAGTYTATVTDANGCSATRTASLTAPPAISVSNSTSTNVTCNNQANGSISISLSGAYTSINWTGPNGPAGSGPMITGLAGGAYTATVNYGSGCTIQHGPVNIVNPPVISISVVNTTQQNGATGGSIDISAMGGTGNLNYQWSGPNSFAAATQDISGLSAGSYVVTVTDANMCSSTQTVTVTSACIVCGATAQVTTEACEEDGCLVVTAPAAATGPFSLSWAGASTGTKTFASGVFSLELCQLKAGAYSITITDGTGQTHTLPQLVVSQRPPVQLSSQLQQPLQANANGSITLSPGPGLLLSYEWISGNVPAGLINSPVLFGLDSGTYCVRVKNQLPNGCTKEYCFTLFRQYAPLAACAGTVVTNPTCLSTANGSIVLNPQGGNSVFSYAWSNQSTAQSLTGVLAGGYTVTVSSGDGQTQVCGPYNLEAQSNLAVSNVNETSNYNGYQVAGVGVCNGVASAVVTGASGTVSYLWSSGETTAIATALCGGSYSLVVTDASGCTSEWTQELTSPAAIAPSFVTVGNYNGFDVSCADACDAIGRITVTGGIPPYIISWPTGKTEILNSSVAVATEDDLCSGDMLVVVTDANGVINNFTYTLTAPDPISITFTGTAPTNLATCDAVIVPEVMGGVGDVEYEWRSQYSQGVTPTAEELCAGEVVTFIITDENGCREMAEFTAPYPADGCFMPSPVLTPNGDGDNDVFVITCVESVENTLEIYNRWNQAVTTRITNYTNNWDGKRAGVALPEGVYYYVLTFKDDMGVSRSLKGYFNIIH